MSDDLCLTWPAGLKVTKTRACWFREIARLKPDMDLGEVSQALGVPYSAARRWAVCFGYHFPDRRRRVGGAHDWASADFSMTDADLARQLGVSRERVRQVRAERRAGPSARRASANRFRGFAVLNRARLHGMPVDEVLRKSGCGVSYDVARRLLRLAGVRPHEPESRWRGVDWRLPNAALATIWGRSAKYLAKVRWRLRAGAAQWDRGRATAVRHGEYLDALARERQKARLMATWPPIRLGMDARREMSCDRSTWDPTPSSSYCCS